jgi:hypothetical protein
MQRLWLVATIMWRQLKRGRKSMQHHGQYSMASCADRYLKRHDEHKELQLRSHASMGSALLASLQQCLELWAQPSVNVPSCPSEVEDFSCQSKMEDFSCPKEIN